MKSKAYFVIYIDPDLWIDGIHKRGGDFLSQWTRDAIRDTLGNVTKASGYITITEDNRIDFTPLTSNEK